MINVHINNNLDEYRWKTAKYLINLFHLLKYHYKDYFKSKHTK